MRLSGLFAICVLMANNAFSVALPENYQSFYDDRPDVVEFFNSGKIETFEGQGGITLESRSFLSSGAKASLVVLNGASFSYAHLDETLLDFSSLGFNIFTYDHRGIGFSGRLQEDTEAMHVDHFAHYIADMDTFVREVVEPQSQGPIFLYCVSLSCLIAAHYMDQYPSTYAGAVFAAPMLDINLYGIPRRVVGWITSVRCTVDCNDYAPNNGGWETLARPKSFFPQFQSMFTSSRRRFWKEVEQQIRDPRLRMGGVTNSWLRETIKAVKAAESIRLSVPLLIYQAGQDVLVNAEGQDRFCLNQERCNKIFFPTSKHVMHREVDAVRDKAISKAKIFLGNILREYGY